MTGREREGLIARIRHVRRLATAADRPDGPSGDRDPQRLRALEARIADLEQLVEGLQDSVHRESERHGKLIAELQVKLEPRAIRAALAEDARDRGL